MNGTKEGRKGEIQRRLPYEHKMLLASSKHRIPTQGQGVSPTGSRIEQIIRETHKYTMLLRRSKDKTYLNLLDSVVASSQQVMPCGTKSDPFPYIRNLRMKRFTEAFYMTYRNMHYIERSLPSITSTFSSIEGKIEGSTATEETTDQIDPSGQQAPLMGSLPTKEGGVEKHIKPILDSIGHNQSIYLL